MKRKNWSLKEFERTVLNKFDTPEYFWVEAINTSCYGLNRVILRPKLKRTLVSFGEEGNPTSHILKFFVQNALFSTPRII